jgi:hypothetical protein
MVGVNYIRFNNMQKALAMFKKAKKTDPNYVAELPLSRRLLVPILGGYASEKLLRRLRKIAVRSEKY